MIRSMDGLRVTRSGPLADDFVASLGVVWDFFATYETSAPLAVIESGDVGRVVADPPDVSRSFIDFFEAFSDGQDTLRATVQPFGNGEKSHDFVMSLGSGDDALVLTFDDGSQAAVETPPPRPMRADPWAAAAASGEAQQLIESFVTLYQLANVAAALPPEDRRVVEASLTLLGETATTARPPKHLVRSVVRFLGEKANLFIDEAVKTAGKAAGVLGVGAGAYVVKDHLPALAQMLQQLRQLAGD
jgi:hypothetical protein